MKSMAYARGIYLVGAVLLVLLFLPVSWFPLMVGKLSLASLCFLVAGVLYVWASWRGEVEALPGVTILVSLLPIVYLLSYAFSIDRAVGVLGTGLEPDTLLFVVLAFIAAMLGSMLFRTVASGWLFVRTLFGALFAAVVFQSVVLLFGLPGPFIDRSVNLVGKWNDFGIAALLLAVLVLVEMQAAHLSVRARRGAWVLLAVLFALLAIVNFATAWILLLVSAAALAVYHWVTMRRVSYAPVATVLVAVVFLFFGSTLNAQFSKVIPVAALEIRPSLQSTLAVAGDAHGSSVKNAALGTGPNTFGMSWLAHKPQEVNASAFWNLDFTVGYSTLATAFLSVGLIGALAWLLPMLLVLFGLLRNRGTAEGRRAMVALGVLSLVWWAIVLLYVPSINMLLLSFMVTGVALGLMWRGAAPISGRLMRSGSLLVLIVLMVWAAAASTRRLMAETHVALGAAALQAGNVDDALQQAARAVSLDANPEDLRLSTDIGAAKLAQIATAAKPGTEQTFATLLQQTVQTGQRAITLDPSDYRSYISLGDVYAYLAANKVAGAYTNAKASYASAAQLAPSSPAIPLMLAKLEASAGTIAGVQDALKQSLTLKPDYTDAILFLAQVDIAQNDLASAIRDTLSAAKTAPGVPSIWLELGLLYYAGGDTKDAIPPLEQAIALQSDYANAQYFLGLSYAAQGRTGEALALFQHLAETNPNNADVKTILLNMGAGRQPLDNGTTTATTTTPIKK